MPKLNRWLMTSIIADIKELIAIANEMCSCIGNVDHLSWRFPTRSAKNLNAMAIVQQHKGSAGEMYILLLEMAYDRMHFLLCLVVQLMEGYPFVKDVLKERATVKKPGNTSLANVVRILWQRLKLIPEIMTRNMVQIKSKKMENSTSANQTSRGCQASGSLSTCESCSCAGRTIGNLTTMISTALRECNLSSVIIEQRESTRADLYDKTQWAVMTKLVGAIDYDLKNLLKMTSEIRSKGEIEAKECEKSLHKMAAEVEEQKTERSSMETKIEEATDQIRAVECQLQRLNQSRAKLVEDNQTLTESLSKAKAKLSNSDILLGISLKQTTEMAESKVALENVVKELNGKMSKERHSSATEIEKLHESLRNFQEEKVSKEKQHHEELEKVRKEYAEAVEKLEQDIRAFESMKDEKLETSPGKISENSVSNGDPEFDMAQQLISNEMTIERLKQQNERLSKTLNRLKEHRRITEVQAL